MKKVIEQAGHVDNYRKATKLMTLEKACLACLREGKEGNTAAVGDGMENRSKLGLEGITR